MKINPRIKIRKWLPAYLMIGKIFRPKRGKGSFRRKSKRVESDYERD
jgi:stalled ribosome alternative rescue factor ArfA